MIHNLQRCFFFIKRYLFAVVSCLYLFIVGMLFAEGRTKVTRIALLFGYRPDVPEAIIPQVPISQLTNNNYAIKMPAPTGADGNVQLIELLILCQWVAGRKCRNIFEIGTYNGRTTYNLAANCPSGATIHTLDLPETSLDSTNLPIATGDRKYINKTESGAYFQGTAEQEKIISLFGDSATFDFSGFQGKMDFVFVDGSHSYEYVLNDSKTALKLVNPENAMIFWHDYSTDKGATRALNELYETRPEFAKLRHVEGTSLAYMMITNQ